MKLLNISITINYIMVGIKDLLDEIMKEERKWVKLEKGPKTFYAKVYRTKKGFTVNIVKNPRKKGKAMKIVKIRLRG